MGLLGNELILYAGLMITVFIFFMSTSEKILGWLYEKSLGNRQYILQKFETMFIENTEKQVTIIMLLLSFGLGILAFLLFWPRVGIGTFMFFVITIVGWQIPKIVVDTIYDKRCAQFNYQMMDALTIMANGIKSGLSIAQSMERVCENMPNPIKQEFNYVLSQVRLGLSVEEALNSMADRIPLPDVQMFVLSINILKETGGDLASTFGVISETIRERQKLMNRIEAMTQQGKTQGVIMTAIPFVILVILSALDPGYVEPLFNSTLGIIFLIIMLFLQIMGGVMIKKIVTIKV